MLTLSSDGRDKESMGEDDEFFEEEMKALYMLITKWDSILYTCCQRKE